MAAVPSSLRKGSKAYLFESGRPKSPGVFRLLRTTAISVEVPPAGAQAVEDNSHLREQRRSHNLDISDIG